MSNDENHSGKPMSLPVMVFWTGLWGGIFWAIIGYLSYLFNFTEIPPYVILDPFALGSLKNKWVGTFISLILFGIFSIAAAFVYYAVLKNFTRIWFGLGYGLLLFLLVFFILYPLFPGMRPVFDLSSDTIITSICIYILYGLFVGYSISYEYQNQYVQKKEAAS